jgi:metallophosphoesterase (TIGR00282 family)
MRILYVAEIVGKAGIFAFKKSIVELKARECVDFVIAGADGATGGNGLGKNHAIYLHKLGADALTLGERCFHKKDLVDDIEKMHHILRPENLNDEAPGYGVRFFHVNGKKVAVAVLLGQSGFLRMHGNNPAALLPLMLERLHEETPFVIIDFHAQATAEKRTLFAIGDGACSAIIGSHTRVQTADETVLAHGTAVITDAGRTGSLDSVGGADAQSRIQEYLSGIPDWTKEAWDTIVVQGVVVDIADNGNAVSIKRICLPIATPVNVEERDDER